MFQSVTPSKQGRTDIEPNYYYLHRICSCTTVMERGHCVVASLLHQIILYIHQIFYYLSLYFIIEELLLEFGQGVVCTVVVQVQGIQHIPEGEKKFNSNVPSGSRCPPYKCYTMNLCNNINTDRYWNMATFYKEGKKKNSETSILVHIVLEMKKCQ